MSIHRSGAEYQSGPGHSRATVAIEDALLRLGIPAQQIIHNSTQRRMRPEDGRAGAKPAKPDISYIDPPTGQRVNIEIDTDPDVSRAHQRQLRAFDRRSRNVFVVIDPRTGAAQQTRVEDPPRTVTAAYPPARGSRISSPVRRRRACARIRTSRSAASQHWHHHASGPCEDRNAGGPYVALR